MILDDPPSDISLLSQRCQLFNASLASPECSNTRTVQPGIISMPDTPTANVTSEYSSEGEYSHLTLNSKEKKLPKKKFLKRSEAKTTKDTIDTGLDQRS